jgi:hypothetical protein
MRRVGRRLGFMTGSVFGVVGGLTPFAGIHSQPIVLFYAGTMLFGLFAGFAHYYRFAAADAAPQAFKSKAISLDPAAAVLAAFIGQEIAKIGRTAFGPVDFHAAYVFVNCAT